MAFQTKEQSGILFGDRPMSNNDDLIIKPKLVKKGSLATSKYTEDKVAPSNVSVGHTINIENQLNNNIEEKVAHLSLQMNQVIVRPYLQQALDYLKTSKHDSINAYNQLSDQIANEIRIISQNTQAISISLKEAQEVVSKTQEIIRNKYNNAIEEDIASGALNLDYEYNIVAEHYELSLQLTQELSRYKARIDSLLSTQKMLDESIVPSVSRLQLEIDNLELLLHSFDSSDYADILARKTGTTISKKTTPTTDFETRSEELNKLVNNSSLNSLNQMEKNVQLNEINRMESPNSQRIVTSAYNSSDFTSPNDNGFNSDSSANNNAPYNNGGGNNSGSTTMNNVQNSSTSFNATNNQQLNNQQHVQMGNNMKNNNNNPQNNFQFNDYSVEGYNGPAPMSKQEMRMMRKLREQQMKFQHMMRMNEMIFEYNKSIDQMMFKQYEYEQMHKQQLDQVKSLFDKNQQISNDVKRDYNNKYVTDNSTNHIYETNVPIETLGDHVRNSKNEKIFVVRQGEPVSERQARELKKRGTVRSIKVVK